MKGFMKLVIFLVFVSCRTPCGQVERLYENNIHGVVDLKKVGNRGIRELSLNKFKLNELNFLYISGDRSKLWNYVDVGDSIYKDAFTYKVEVIKKNESKFFTMNFPKCPRLVNNK